MEITKRNGQKELYNPLKIKEAIKAAFNSVNYTIDESLYDEIVNSVKIWDGASVYDIEDEVIELLRNYGYGEVADSYLIYKYKHAQARKLVESKKKFIQKYKESSNTANATIDDNSNVSNKNIGILNAEGHKEENILISRGMITDKLKELFPDFDAKQYVRDLEHHIIYKHDESSFMGAIAPYCCSISMYPFLNSGLKELGGLSASPKNLDSFCGMYVNLIFAVSGQFAGACLYKDQRLNIKKGGIAYNTTIKRLVEENLNNSIKFSNYQGDWEYAICNDVQILEDNKVVKVNKVYRRKYSDKIYKISTKDGHSVKVSKDHIFKQLFQGRLIDIKASQLQPLDTVIMNKDYSSVINHNNKEFKKGWIIGMLCGDGCLTKESSIGLSVNYEQEYLGNIFNDYLKEIYGFELHKNKGHRCWNYTKRSQTLVDLIHQDIIGNTAYDKHINLNNKSLDYIVGFLDGLFCANGSYSESHGITISLTNKELALNVNNAIKYFDIQSNICVVPSKDNKKESYRQYITSKILKYLYHVHKKVLKRGCKNIYDSSREIYYYGYNAFQGRNLSNKRMLWSNSKQEQIYNTDVIESIDIIDNDDEYVYEIETETHWYNCGGFITHNCATSEFLLYFDYFARKEWGDNYYQKPDVIITSEHSYRTKTIKQQIHQHFQQVIYSINQPAAARGLQSAFVNFSYFDKPFFEAMFGNFVFPDMTSPIWESLNWLQKEFMQWFNAERLKCIITFPVESVALIYQNGKFVDEEMADFVAEEYARGHSFFTYISDTADSLSSCCRLKNKINTKEFNFTNGNMGVETGSKSVITLNLNRIIQDWCRKIGGVPTIDNQYDSLKLELDEILERIYKYHTAYNECLWDMYDAGLLPVYQAGFISLNKQYLTIGINGLNQSAEFLGIECRDNEAYKQYCQTVFGIVKDANNRHNGKFNSHKLSFNTECVPAESLAIKNYNWDKADGYWVPTDTNLYASYIFKPNDPNTSVLEKFILHGKEYIGEYLDGGSAAHINLSEHLSKEQYKQLLKFAAENGCQYFTFNIPNCECADCGYIAKQPFDKCPKCNSSKTYLWDRVIGYLSKIKNWSTGRQIEQKTRIYEKNLMMK